MQISSTINHTGRRKIRRDEIRILVSENPESVPEFEAFFSFRKEGLPDTAAVFVEAYHRNTLQRFDFGTVSQTRPPDSLKLDEIDLSGPVLFRVRIVDQAENAGRSLASADRIRPEGDNDEDQRSSLIIVRSKPMGEEVWKMSFEGGGKPELLVNSRIPDPIGQIKTNHLFQALILPAAFREILMYFLWNEDEEEDSVQLEWIRFAEHLAGEKPHESDPFALKRWIDEVVEQFSARFRLCEMLVLKMDGTRA